MLWNEDKVIENVPVIGGLSDSITRLHREWKWIKRKLGANDIKNWVTGDLVITLFSLCMFSCSFHAIRFLWTWYQNFRFCFALFLFEMIQKKAKLDLTKLGKTGECAKGFIEKVRVEWSSFINLKEKQEKAEKSYNEKFYYANDYVYLLTEVLKGHNSWNFLKNLKTKHFWKAKWHGCKVSQ